MKRLVRFVSIVCPEFLDFERMDMETLRLEREEKRRQRRERIRKILEDDPSPTRRSREEPDSTTTARYTATSRRPRENVESSTTTERTRNYYLSSISIFYEDYHNRYSLNRV